jgi:hypothetical protein
MPLLDHFHPPLFPRRHWESFHVNWAGAIADVLNERLLPEGYFAEEHVHFGPRVEIDVSTWADGGTASKEAGNGTTTAAPVRVWSPPAPSFVVSGAFPDSVEILVFESEGGPTQVASVELVSPSNKDRARHRRAFTAKCASYLAQGVGLIIIDIVTSRRANLHNELMTLLEHEPATHLPAEDLYAVAYQPIVRDETEQIDVWTTTLHVGEPLPTLPLALNAELRLPVDLEETYTAACQRRRL